MNPKIIFLSSNEYTVLPSAKIMVLMGEETSEYVRDFIHNRYGEFPIVSYLRDFICEHVNKDLGLCLVGTDEEPPPPPFDEYDLIVVPEVQISSDRANCPVKYMVGLGGAELNKSTGYWEPPMFGEWRTIN